MQLTKEHFLKIYGDYLEPNTDINQKNVVFKCPFHVDSNPSYAVSTDPTHPVGHCFSCSEKNSWIGFYQKTRNVDYKTALKELDLFEENHVTQPKYVHPHPEQLIPKEVKHKTVEVDYTEYRNKCIDNYFNNYEVLGKKLYELRGITLPTAIVCMIGYDENKGWIYPIYRYSDFKCVGYEVRHKEFKIFDFNKSKCYKAPNSQNCLSIVYRAFDNKKAVICEGFQDSFKMYQYLHEREQQKQKLEFAQVPYTILTPSNGVKTIPELIEKLELWNDFDEILCVLDNDKAGNDTKKELEIISNNHNENIKFFDDLKEGEDFEDYYDNLMKGRK